jgi:Mn2+/Fe2+ NRAMP family transporter
MLGQNWTYSRDNRLFRRLLILVTLLAAVLAPVWTFPAMLKVILLMGVNVLIIPMVIIAMIYLLNKKAVMGEHTAGFWRNLMLVLCLVVAIALGIDKLPDYLAMF